MAEVLIRFDSTIDGPSGRAYRARACGRIMDDGHRWEGWIEFDPGDSQPVLRTERETVQPNREDLLYWATGLSDAYLEGALNRAIELTEPVPLPAASERPTYEGPAGHPVHHAGPRADHPHAILDPFHAYAQGDDVLRRQLGAMGPMHLRTIIRAYDFSPPDDESLERMGRHELEALIMDEVRRRKRA